MGDTIIIIIIIFLGGGGGKLKIIICDGTNGLVFLGQPGIYRDKNTLISYYVIPLLTVPINSTMK